jgi:hypothetical protein
MCRPPLSLPLTPVRGKRKTISRLSILHQAAVYRNESDPRISFSANVKLLRQGRPNKRCATMMNPSVRLWSSASAQLIPVLLQIFVFCVIVLVSGGDPQVYEDVDDQVQIESSNRVVRDPFKQKPKLYKPQAFQFHAAAQQDPRSFRYAQQQRVDMLNMLKNRFGRSEEGPTRVPSTENWKIVEPTVSSSVVEEHFKLPEGKNGTSRGKFSTRKPRTSRKLKPSSYYEGLQEKIKRQDNNQVIYVNPQLVKISRSEQDLHALSALVGQHPNHQLEGLKRLLDSPQSNFVLPPIKGPLPSPVTEQLHDVPNLQTHPNIDQTLSIEAIQSQLDHAAKAQLEKALADAQQQALAHVEAQHQAIAKAQEQARNKALAQIALHNQGIKTEPLPRPLPLVQQKVVPVNLYAPAHHHQNQKDEPVKAQSQANLKKVSITKTHSITQGTQSPNAYQQVVLETQQSQRVLGVNHLGLAENADEVSRPQYFHIERIKRGVDSNETVDYDYEYDYDTDVSGSIEGAQSQPLRRYRKRKRKPRPVKHHSHSHNHSPHYHPLHYVRFVKPKPVKEKSKNDVYDGVSKILPSKKENQPANVIVINNSNDNHNHGSNVYPAASIVHKTKLNKHKHRIRVHHRPNIKKLHKIQTKVELALMKVNERG